MQLCKNGLYAPYTFQELSRLVRHNLSLWDERAIERIWANPSRGIYANSGGPVHAHIKIQFVENLKSLLFHPDSILGEALERKEIYAPIPEKPIKDENRLFADFEETLYCSNSQTKLEKYYIPNLQQTLCVAEESQHGIEKVLRKSLDNIEGFSLQRGSIEFRFHGSNFDKNEYRRWLKTLPPAIEIVESGEKRLLGLSVVFSYPTMEVML